MKTKLALLICSISATALAGPSRPIQSSTFSVQAPCGPAHDPLAQQGQWFFELGTGATNVNAREYHDEDNALSIAGVAQNITFSNPANPYSNIMAFEIVAVVSNTLPSDYQYGGASNSHGEVQSPTAVSDGGSTMDDVRITAEFALVNPGVIPSGQPPYWPEPVSGGQYYIYALNADAHAWYCWDPNQQNPQYQPAGAYQVPAWNLVPSAIAPGGTATVRMQFQVTGTGIPYSDYRHGVLRYSQDTGADVLYNRYPSLKISHWLDTIVVDNGVTLTTPPYPYWEGQEIEYIHASDASVFYNDLETEESHKMHWPQMPDPNGWDVHACWHEQMGVQKVLADDFLCTRSGPITNITFWGSWFNDQYDTQDPWQGITKIHLSMHDDIPDPDGEGPEYSKPQLPPLRVLDIDLNALPPGWNVVVTPEQPSWQGWYDPNLNEFIPNNHTNYFRYDITIPADEAFAQTSNTIYWLDVSVETADPAFKWGWKTTTDHWNDDAVWADMPVTNLSQWKELYEPPQFEQSLDLAFIIDGGEEEPVETFDWGDAPDQPYPTLAANLGASHLIVPGVRLGASIDPEPDGQPNATATGDDNDGNNDDDGLVFNTPLIPGATASVTANASAPGFLDAWIDYNADGTWAPAEQLGGASIPLVAGANNVPFTVPASAVPTPSTFARFRFSTAGGLQPIKPAPDGEVEDYEVSIDELDFGDAPDGPYPTLSASSGASHLIPGGVPALMLGWQIDGEPDGQPTPNADGDDLAGLADEDGVVFATPQLHPGTVAQVTVYAGTPSAAAGFAYLDAWVDFNNDGTWGPTEKVFSSQLLTFTGPATPAALTFPVPAGAVAGPTFARFRLSTTSTGLPPTGHAADGEVEDYPVDIAEPLPVDWGDAPDAPYPTLAANNGAHHVIDGIHFLGGQVDPEADGQPNGACTGDDTDLVFPSMGDDEDGVFFKTLPQRGGYVRVDVVASTNGFLDAWVDFNNDGDWADSNERIFTAQALTNGINPLIFPVPLAAATGSQLPSRWRFSSAGVVSYTGLALDGEVEDHLMHEVVPLDSGSDFGDAVYVPDTVLPNGAQHVITAGIMLGSSIDAEPDGQPDPQAIGDDNNTIFPGLADDEDGVVFTSKLVAGSNATVDVVAGVSGGRLDAWIDFTNDGDWLDANEKILSVPVAAGLNSLSFTVPGLPAQGLGQTHARFRISSAGTPLPTGLAPDGEVEDYVVDLYQPAPTNSIVITNQTFDASYSVTTNEWTVENGIIYQMESNTNLVTGTWVPAGATVIGPVNSQTDNMTAETNKFYRVTVPFTP